MVPPPDTFLTQESGPVLPAAAGRVTRQGAISAACSVRRPGSLVLGAPRPLPGCTWGYASSRPDVSAGARTRTPGEASGSPARRPAAQRPHRRPFGPARAQPGLPPFARRGGYGEISVARHTAMTMASSLGKYVRRTVSLPAHGLLDRRAVGMPDSDVRPAAAVEAAERHGGRKGARVGGMGSGGCGAAPVVTEGGGRRVDTLHRGEEVGFPADAEAAERCRRPPAGTGGKSGRSGAREGGRGAGYGLGVRGRTQSGDEYGRGTGGEQATGAQRWEIIPNPPAPQGFWARDGTGPACGEPLGRRRRPALDGPAGSRAGLPAGRAGGRCPIQARSRSCS